MPKQKYKNLKSVLKNSIALFFWIYLILKVFIFDIDSFLINNYSPSLAWILEYKFFLLIFIFAICLIIIEQKKVLYFILYLMTYPLVVFFWKIPSLLYKKGNWNINIALLDALSSTFVSLKYNFITTTFLLISLLMIFISQNKIILYTSSFVLLILVLMAYFRRLIFVLKPSNLHQFFKNGLDGLSNYGSKNFKIADDLKNFPVQNLDEKQLEKWTGSLQSTVLLNIGCIYIAKKLRDYQKSGYNIVAYIFMVFFLILLTVIAFAAVNFGLFKINPTLYKWLTSPNFFTFFYYSFNNLIFNSIQELSPTGTLSQSASMLESFFSLFLLGITISLIFSFRAQRHTEELDTAIKQFEIQGRKVELFIRDEYNFQSVEEAIAELERLKSSSISIIIALHKGNLS